MPNNEVERLKRLREQQIAARDPRQADRRREAIVSKRPRTTFSLREELQHLGAKVTWMLWGAVIGVAAGLGFSTVLSLAFQVNWGAYLVVGMVLFCGFLGYTFGSIKDSGRENWLK